MAATVDPNTPQSNTSSQPQSFVQKNNAGATGTYATRIDIDWDEVAAF